MSTLVHCVLPVYLNWSFHSWLNPIHFICLWCSSSVSFKVPKKFSCLFFALNLREQRISPTPTACSCSVKAFHRWLVHRFSVSSLSSLLHLMFFSIAGFVADQNSYALTYSVIGIGTALAALLLFTMPLVQRCYGFLNSKSAARKTNTLVTASNGDLPAPPTTN